MKCLHTKRKMSRLYLWVDAGEPHLYRELIMLPIGTKGLKTKTSLNYQFWLSPSQRCDLPTDRPVAFLAGPVAPIRSGVDHIRTATRGSRA